MKAVMTKMLRAISDDGSEQYIFMYGGSSFGSEAVLDQTHIAVAGPYKGVAFGVVNEMTYHQAWHEASILAQRDDLTWDMEALLSPE